jgi:hypothetical protein
LLRKLQSHATYANVVATIALFLALGGGAYALTLPKNSVKSKHIKDGQVKTNDLGDGQVTSADAQDNGLTGTDILESSLGQVPSAANADQLDGLDSASFQRGGYRLDTSGSATPSVSGVSLLDMQPAGNIAVTNLPGAAPGQVITIKARNDMVDVNDSGNFLLLANWTPDAADTLTVVAAPSGAGFIFFEVSRVAIP